MGRLQLGGAGEDRLWLGVHLLLRRHPLRPRLLLRCLCSNCASRRAGVRQLLWRLELDQATDLSAKSPLPFTACRDVVVVGCQFITATGRALAYRERNTRTSGGVRDVFRN